MVARLGLRDVAVSMSIFLAVMLIVVGCSSGDGGEPPVKSETPDISAETPTPTSAPTTTLSPTTAVGSELKLEDAPQYLDASAVLPGFRQVEPGPEGLSNADLGLGPGFSEVVVFLSDEPFQTVALFMTVLSGEIEKARERDFLRSGGVIDSFLYGFDTDNEDTQVKDIRTIEVAVGDLAQLATLNVESIDFGTSVAEEFIVFYQDKGQQAVLVFVLNVGTEKPPTIDSVTIAQEVSARIEGR